MQAEDPPLYAAAADGRVADVAVPEPMMMAGSPERPPASTPGVGAGGDLPSPTRILTTSPILSEKRGRA